ncbi:hypothetical protein J5Y03_12305 [Bacillus sp. RG28]|uniref:Uncharacterized protein n=1 Tax=Gottfriedia endophytica TaxID=2820819 RepID=A0A940NPI9_9BACI|nr:hypothetical protein [Gottfriedia endophytica]MBP0725954.1 hypothetical protein [Gottfriedia endophytica]
MGLNLLFISLTICGIGMIVLYVLHRMSLATLASKEGLGGGYIALAWIPFFPLYPITYAKIAEEKVWFKEKAIIIYTVSFIVSAIFVFIDSSFIHFIVNCIDVFSSILLLNFTYCVLKQYTGSYKKIFWTVFGLRMGSIIVWGCIFIYLVVHFLSELKGIPLDNTFDLEIAKRTLKKVFEIIAVPVSLGILYSFVTELVYVICFFRIRKNERCN